MNFKNIITHPGVFHADDAMAVALLKVSLGNDLPVARRNPTPEELSDPQVVVVDVGGEFDAARSNYDHHQREYSETREVDGLAIPLSAFGLLWHRHNFPLRYPEGISAAMRPKWHKTVDSLLVRAIDAADCGWKPRLRLSGGTNDVWVDPSERHDHYPVRFSVNIPPSPVGCTISQAIAWLNPGTGATPAERDAAFLAAVGICGQILDGVFRNATEQILAKAAVMAAEAEGGNILVLEEFVPWQEQLVEREDQDDLLYVVYPSARGGWMVQQIPESAGSFEGRKPLPADWAGLRGQALREITNVADATFVHPGRFCGGAESREGALEMARLAVQA